MYIKSYLSLDATIDAVKCVDKAVILMCLSLK